MPIGLEEADRRLVALILKYNLDEPVKFVTPINGKEEKEKFFAALSKGEKYNPQFRYAKLPFAPDDVMREIGDIMRELRGMEIDYSTVIGRIFEKRRHDLMNKLKLIRRLGTPAVTKYSLRLYGPPPRRVLNQALKVCTEFKKEVEKEFPYDAKVVKAEIEKALEELGIRGWKVEIKEGLAATKVTTAEKTVEVKAEAHLNRPLMEYIKGLVAHEIRGHLMRWKKGEQRGFKIFRYGTSGYQPTEEALAMRMQREAAGLTPKTEARMALRVLAAHYAMKHSFYDLFCMLRRFDFDDKTLYNVVARVKRGLSDTSKPGGYIKDHVYFMGGMEIDDYINAGGDLKLLETGKIGVNDIEDMLAEARGEKRGFARYAEKEREVLKKLETEVERQEKEEGEQGKKEVEALEKEIEKQEGEEKKKTKKELKRLEKKIEEQDKE